MVTPTGGLPEVIVSPDCIENGEHADFRSFDCNGVTVNDGKNVKQYESALVHTDKQGNITTVIADNPTDVTYTAFCAADGTKDKCDRGHILITQPTHNASIKFATDAKQVMAQAALKRDQLSDQAANILREAVADLNNGGGRYSMDGSDNLYSIILRDGREVLRVWNNGTLSIPTDNHENIYIKPTPAKFGEMAPLIKQLNIKCQYSEFN
jgi:hypothetical protein